MNIIDLFNLYLEYFTIHNLLTTLHIIITPHNRLTHSTLQPKHLLLLIKTLTCRLP